MKTFYHITPKNNLSSILEKGLQPSIGERSQKIGEMEAVVYLFPTLEDVEVALSTWLGEAFEDDFELLSLLEIQIENETEIFSVVGYEVIVKNLIPAERISVLAENIDFYDFSEKKSYGS